MSKTIKNTKVLSPVSSDPLPKEVDAEGKITEEWNVVGLIMAAVGNQPCKTVDDMHKNTRVYNALKEQEDKKEAVLEDADFDHAYKTCNEYSPFLGKGMLFINLYKALDEAKEGKKEETRIESKNK